MERDPLDGVRRFNGGIVTGTVVGLADARRACYEFAAGELDTWAAEALRMARWHWSTVKRVETAEPGTRLTEYRHAAKLLAEFAADLRARARELREKR